MTVLFSDSFSIAKCLGARTVAPHLLEILPQFRIISEVVTDAQAVKSCIQFAGLLHVVNLYQHLEYTIISSIIQENLHCYETWNFITTFTFILISISMPSSHLHFSSVAHMQFLSRMHRHIFPPAW
jgi:hypothetical protein